MGGRDTYLEGQGPHLWEEAEARRVSAGSAEGVEGELEDQMVEWVRRPAGSGEAHLEGAGICKSGGVATGGREAGSGRPGGSSKQRLAGRPPRSGRRRGAQWGEGEQFQRINGRSPTSVH